MAPRRPRSGLFSRVRVWHVAVAWALLMSPLAWWGLPSARDDALLFGPGGPWPAERFGAAEALRQRGERAAGADTDVNPIAVPQDVANLTADDAARAEILRRYRLYSRQPDEMITFMALARMRPRQLDLDPRLYQYGGAYIYMVGGAIAAASLVGVTRLTGDVDVYLEHPELFARFYVVARFISLAFAAAMLVAAARVADRIRRAASGALSEGHGAPTGRSSARDGAAGWIAALLLACCPVFITAALEAKPHLPSACLLVWAVLAAWDYCETGRRAAALRLGLFSGAALGLVLTGALAAVLWPAAWWAARPRRRRVAVDLLIAGGVALGVYAVTNPFVFINLLFHRDVLASNLANSTAMYTAGRLGEGAWRVGFLLFAGCGPLIPPLGLLGLAFLLPRAGRPAALLAVLAAAGVAVGVLLGAGKPDEFARFLLLPAAALAIGAAVVVTAVPRFPWLAATGVLVGTIVPGGTWAYLRAFYVDAWTAGESRRVAGERLRGMMAEGEAVGVLQVPAPYAVPPLDFATRAVVLLPSAAPPDQPRDLPRWLVFTADSAHTHLGASWQRDYRPVFSTGRTDGATGIAWADKPTFVYERR